MIPRLPGIVIALGTVLSADTQAQTKSAVGGCYRLTGRILAGSDVLPEAVT